MTLPNGTARPSGTTTVRPVFESVVLLGTTPKKTSLAFEQPASRALPPWTDPHLTNSRWNRTDPEARAQVLAAIGRSAWPLVLYGATGSGKSCLAACLFRWFPSPNDPRHPVLWVQAAAEVRALTTAWREGQAPVLSQTTDMVVERSEHWLLSRMRDAAFVVLDDLGLRTPTESQQDAVLEIINARSGKPTVITTNLSMQRLAQTYDDRIVSRLAAGVAISVQGQDRRAFEN